MAMTNAEMLNPLTALKNEERVYAAYRPKGDTLPKEVVKLILKHLDIDPAIYNPEADADPIETHLRNASRYPNRRRYR